jgi:predicted membrane protein
VVGVVAVVAVGVVLPLVQNLMLAVQAVVAVELLGFQVALMVLLALITRVFRVFSKWVALVTPEHPRRAGLAALEVGHQQQEILLRAAEMAALGVVLVLLVYLVVPEQQAVPLHRELEAVAVAVQPETTSLEIRL